MAGQRDKVTEKYVEYISAKKQEKAFSLELRIMALNKIKGEKSVVRRI